MPFNGSGGFNSLAAPIFPAVAGTTIISSYYNNQLNDVFSGLGQVITRNGQSPWTGNLPAGGYKITNLGAGSTAGDSLSYGQNFGAILGTDLTTTGNTILGDAVGDTLNVAAGSFRVDASGNVGVNITPLGDTIAFGGKTAEIQGPLYARQNGTTTNFVAVGASAGSGYIVANATGGTAMNLVFQTGSVTRATLSTTGLALVAALSATTGTFSGAVSMAGLTATTGTFSGAISGVTDLTTTGNTILGDGVGDTLNVGAGSLRVDASGNVGIAAAPIGANKLYVLGVGNSTVRIDSSSATVSPYVGFYYNTSGTALGFVGGSGLATGGGVGDMVLRGENSLIFSIASTLSAKLDSSGNFGLNMTPLGDTAGYGGRAIEAQGAVYGRQNGTPANYLAIGAAAGSAYLVAAGASLAALPLSIQIGSTTAATFDSSRNLVIGNAATSAGKFSVISGTTGGAAGLSSVWSNSYSVFGPNAASTTGAALGVGYNTTGDQAEIFSAKPGTAWKPLAIFSQGCNFYAVAGSLALSIDPTGQHGVGLVPVTSGNNRGLLQLLGSANGGIYLGNTANSAANVLDWYEENISSFAPTLSFGGSSTGVAYNINRSGTYVRIGTLVFWQVRMALSSKGSATGSASIDMSGIPYAPISTGIPVAVSVSISSYGNMTGLTGTLLASFLPGSNTIGIQQGGSTSAVSLTDASFTNTSDLFICGWHRV